jgi:hypothetical protein
MQDILVLAGSLCSIVILVILWKFNRQLDSHTQMFEILNKHIHNLSEMIAWHNKNISHLEGCINRLMNIMDQRNDSGKWKG